MKYHNNKFHSNVRPILAILNFYLNQADNAYFLIIPKALFNSFKLGYLRVATFSHYQFQQKPDNIDKNSFKQTIKHLQNIWH